MKKAFSHKFSMSHISFTLVFCSLIFVSSNFFNLDKITKWFMVGDNIDYAGLIAYLCFALCFFIAFFTLFANRWTIKPVSIFFILASAAASYFITKYNVAIDRSMIENVIHTDSTEVKSLLSTSMLPYLFFLVILPLLFVFKTNITFGTPLEYIFSSLILFVFSLILGVSVLYANYNSIHRAGNISNKYILHSLTPTNYIRSIGSVIHRSVQAYNRKNKKKVEVIAKVKKIEDLVVVLAIGESARKKSFSLYGYERKNTNPYLSKVEGLHLLNGNAQIGTTLLAIREILDRDDIKLPEVTSKLGIDTSCYINFTLYDNCDAVGEVKVNNCGHDGECYDEDVIPLLEKNLKSYESGYRFVILHMGGGSHGPIYKDRHPPEFQKFKPQCLEADVVNHCTKEQLYNSYDNTILYTDYVLDKALKTIEASGVPYVFIYISDHGESLLEDGRIFHGMPPGIDLPPEQAEVPLIIKSSVPILIEKRDKYEQVAIFDSILSLFSVETPIMIQENIFLKKAIVEQPSN